MFAIQLAAAIGAAHWSQLDDLARTLWKGHGAGLLSAEEAQRLAEAIKAHRVPRTALPASSRPSWSLFPLRRPQPAKLHPERVGRRRRLAASAPLPPALASAWTTGELAVLRIVGDEVREAGSCDRTLAEIAARAGVCRSLAQATLRRASRLGLVLIEERPRSGAKNLSNVVRIVSPEWRTWIDRGPRRQNAAEAAGLTGIGSKSLDPTDILSFSSSKNRTSVRRFSGLGEKRRPAEPPSGHG